MTQRHKKAYSIRLMTAVIMVMAVVFANTPATADETAIQAGKGTFIKVAKPASSVFVANPDIADVEIKFPEMLYVYAKKPGVTTVHAMDADGRIILSKDITVQTSTTEIETSLKKLMPDSPLEVSALNNKVILKGTVRSAADADMALKIASSFVAEDEDLINMIGVNESNQITLRVRVAEVNRSLTQLFGIEWQGLGTHSDFGWGTFSKDALFIPEGNTFTAGAFNNLDIQKGTYKLLTSFANGDFSLDILLNALEDQGLLTLLAEPNLTAISGETASFLAGGEFPILIRESDETNVIFKEFGVSLKFAPVVLSNNRIRLKVNPVVSELSDQGAVQLNGLTIPALTTRKAETTVELGDGESFSIAGIFQNSIRDDIKKFPWLGDLPVLGQLFRSQQYIRKDSELLIIITPYLVEPVSSGTKMATPLDKIYIPSDKDRVWFGQTTQTSIIPSRFMENSSGLAGPVGFIIE